MKQNSLQIVPGDDLFKLHDTFGFPLDLATDVAEERGYQVDRDGFDTAMTRQREQARSAWAGSGQQAVAPVYREVQSRLDNTDFVGYETCACAATIETIIKDNKETESLTEGESAEFILDKTPFYAESGGQVSDVGFLEGPSGTAQVNAVRRLVGKSVLHQASVVSGSLHAGELITARVDEDRRRKTENHHTATHLLQAALRNALGEHVHQAGSYVGPDRLRFDFTHFESIGLERLQDIEREVNAAIRADIPVETSFKSLDEARAEGAMALFGEKYDDIVRMVKAGGVSKELCGGCHVPRTGVIGYFKILSESAVAAGVRRIEAVCGAPCVEVLQARERQLLAAAHLLSARPDDLETRLRSLLDENKRLTRDVERWKQTAATGGGGGDIMSQIKDVKGIKTLILKLSDMDAKSLRALLDQCKEKIGSGVVVLGSDSEDKVALAAGVTKDLTHRISAGEIVSKLAPLVGGGGGGRADMAQAGGKDVDKLPDAMKQAEAIVAALLQ